MKNYMLRIAYDGSNFKGYQLQDGERTVSAELKTAIETLLGRKTRIIAAGRTDAGVHAREQIVNFLTTTDISAKGFSYHLQKHLPDDILCWDSVEVPLNFHSRFASRSKTYKYVVSLKNPMMPMDRKYKANCTYKLDFNKMSEVLSLFEGVHDFSAFSKNDPLRQPIRPLDSFEMNRVEDELIFILKGESFLHNQVRILIGAVIQVGREKLSLKEIEDALKNGSTSPIAPTYPACGLTLEHIELKS